ncbi:retention module-containing protein [Castellaniella sp.]|uniref:retention module-containing protein n=1 Tax=Castellaniella sp. TaxID=1955812 RepID=UPI002AFEDB4C|nr:retention module-containing protein [Castellaniella sp.]
MATDTVLITQITGKAWMRTADGQLIALHQGMRVPVDAHILTDEGASVTLQATGVPPVIVGQNTDMLVSDDLAQVQPLAVDHAVTPPVDSIADQVLAALDAGQDPFGVLDPTAAVLTGGGGGGASFTRLVAITETVTPLDLSYPRQGLETPEFVLLGGAPDLAANAAPEAPTPAAPTLTIPDENTHPGGDGEGGQLPPVNLPGTINLVETQTLASGDPGVGGSILFSAPAGLSGIHFTFTNESGVPQTLDVTQAMLDALNNPGASPIVLDTQKGLLHLDGYNAATGAIHYTYWSDGPQDHTGAPADPAFGGAPGTDDYVMDGIQIVVTDDLGRSTTPPQTLGIAITDTVPDPQPDANSVTEDTALSAVGNVISGAGSSNPAAAADHAYDQPAHVVGIQWQGDTSAASWLPDAAADHAVDVATPGATTTIHGQYGDLVIDAQGNYTYTLAAEGDALGRYAAVQALGVNSHPTETFAYQLSDEDGDIRSTTLTITVNGTNDVPTVTFDCNGRDQMAVVSEEGLLIVGGNYDNGIPGHGLNQPSGDWTNQTTDAGHFQIADPDTDLSGVTVAFGIPGTTALSVVWNPAYGSDQTVPLTSHGQLVQWATSGSLATHDYTLIGTVADATVPGGVRTVLEVHLAQGSTPGDYSYTVDLKGAIDHPITTNAAEDVLNLNIPLVVDDGQGGVTPSHITVRVEDDSPYIQDTQEQGTATTEHIPDVYVGTVDFSGDSSGASLSFDNGAILVTGQGFESSTDPTLTAATVVQTGGGLGVSSPGESYFPLPGEIDYRNYHDQPGASETLTVALQDGKVAYSAHVEFSKMFGGELESGVVEFWRGGTKVGEQAFNSDAASGNYAADFNADSFGGFDTLVFRATSNGNTNFSDNSDFAVQSITFGGSELPHAIAYGTGDLSYQYGADGAGTVHWNAPTTAVYVNGQAVTVTPDSHGTTLTGMVNGALAFQLILTQATGQWEFYEYKPLTDASGEALTGLPFSYTVTDADGDPSVGNLQIGLPEAPTVDVPDTNGQMGGELSVVEHDGAVSGSFAIVAHGTGLTLDIQETGAHHTVDLASLQGGTDQVINLDDGSVMTLTGYTPSGSGGGTVSYSYQSNQARDHSAGDDSVLDHLVITAHDSQGTGAGNLDILIQDTHPDLVPITQTVAVGSGGVNIMLVLDRSGSMDEDSSIPGKTRMEALKEALDHLFDAYQDSGQDVRVMVVGFSSHASVLGDQTWMTLADARTVVQNLSAGGNTNYDDALDKAEDHWIDSGKLTGSNVDNVAYFFSDGEPNEPSHSEGINSTEQSTWETFLTSHSIDSYAIGLGDGAHVSSLQPIGYDPAAATHPDDQNTIRVTDYSQLNSTVLDLVHIPVSGDVTAGDTLIGADIAGSYIESVTVDGHTYAYAHDGGVTTTAPAADWSFDTNTDKLTIHATGGTFIFDLQGTDLGHYSYVASQLGTEVVQYTLHDGDNDQQTSTITFNAVADAPVTTQTATATMLSIDHASSPDSAPHGTVADPSGKDVLDVSQLLQGHGGDLTQYLNIQGDSANHTTTVNISTTGNVGAGHDQQIVIDNVDLTAGVTDQTTLINNMISDGKLKVDHS